MPDNDAITPDDAERRRHAEARLRGQRPEAGAERIDADTQRLVHELEVHQVELEMQNEELKQARDAAEAALEKYSDLYDFAPVGYLTFDREGTIQEANLAAASLLGIERAHLVKRRLGLFISEAGLPVFTAFLARVFESKTKQSCEVTLLREGKPGVEARIEAAASASGLECRAAVTDITERKQIEVDRLILSKLESAAILAGGIAHDFNNLLTMILLNVELAQTLVPPGEELASILEQAKQATLMSASLTQQLVTFAKGGELVRKPTRLSGVIRESVRPALSGSRVRCDFALAGDLWSADVDAGQIGQVIRNLVLNAREAMPGGGVVAVRAENVVLGLHQHLSLPPGDYVRVSISDSGGGIATKLLPKIFDPYFSTKQRGTQKGMGLGLTICHTIVQQHGGAIDVESVPGFGTTFRFFLPASRRAPQQERTSERATWATHGRILVMDDEEVVRNLVRRWLQWMGHQVELAEDGQQAVDLYGSAMSQGPPFDAVILDLTVRGGMGGQEAIQALLRLNPAVRAIVMSGYADDPVVREPERHGFKGVLAKPFDSNSLRKALAGVLEASIQ